MFVEVTKEKKQYKGFSVTSMVLGIVSLVFFASVYITIIGGVLAIVFGAITLKKGDGTCRKMAMAGFVMGIVGLALILLIFVLVVAVGVELIDTFDYYSY